MVQSILSLRASHVLLVTTLCLLIASCALLNPTTVTRKFLLPQEQRGCATMDIKSILEIDDVTVAPEYDTEYLVLVNSKSSRIARSENTAWQSRPGAIVKAALRNELVKQRDAFRRPYAEDRATYLLQTHVEEFAVIGSGLLDTRSPGLTISYKLVRKGDFEGKLLFERRCTYPARGATGYLVPTNDTIDIAIRMRGTLNTLVNTLICESCEAISQDKSVLPLRKIGIAKGEFKAPSCGDCSTVQLRIADAAPAFTTTTVFAKNGDTLRYPGAVLGWRTKPQEMILDILKRGLTNAGLAIVRDNTPLPDYKIELSLLDVYAENTSSCLEKLKAQVYVTALVSKWDAKRARYNKPKLIVKELLLEMPEGLDIDEFRASSLDEFAKQLCK